MKSNHKFKTLVFLTFTFFNLMASMPFKSQKIDFPDYIGWVNDFGNLLNDEQINELTEIIEEYEKETSREIVIITINSISPETEIIFYAAEIGEYWGVGKKGKDNGVVILVCKPCREMCISTGTGTEKTLSDQICKKIIDKSITPEFKKNNYYKGLKKGLKEIIKNWD